MNVSTTLMNERERVVKTARCCIILSRLLPSVAQCLAQFITISCSFHLSLVSLGCAVNKTNPKTESRPSMFQLKSLSRPNSI